MQLLMVRPDALPLNIRSAVLHDPLCCTPGDPIPSLQVAGARGAEWPPRTAPGGRLGLWDRPLGAFVSALRVCCSCLAPGAIQCCNALATQNPCRPR